MSATASHVLALATPDGIPLAPLVPVACAIVGLILGYLLCQRVIERLALRCGYVAQQLDETRAALEAEQQRAVVVQVRLRGELAAARADAEVARGLARPRGLLP